jgi:hypothetical protein
MLAWIIIIGVFAGATVICAIEGLVTSDTGLLVGSLLIEAVLVPLFMSLIGKYRDPEYRAEMEERKRKAQEDREYYEKLSAGAAEREQLRKKFEAEEQAKKFEAERLQSNIVATRLLGDGSPEYKKSVGSMVARGAVGSIFGSTGSAIGMATTKSKNVNKDVRRFLVKYKDGHIEEKEATIGSKQYKIYMSFLEWE